MKFDKIRAPCVLAPKPVVSTVPKKNLVIAIALPYLGKLSLQ